MNGQIFLLILILPIKLSKSINCYSCNGGIGCNDPFNSLGTDVMTTGTSSTNIYCSKTNNAGKIFRSGGSSCSSYWYSSNGYNLCCQTDFCNGTKSRTNIGFYSMTFGFFLLYLF